MEDNNNYRYTYRREKQRQQQRLRLIMLISFLVLLFLCIVFGCLFGSRAAGKTFEKEYKPAEQTTEPAAEEPSSEAPATDIRLGEYMVVDTGKYQLSLRERPSKNSKVYTYFSDGTKLTVTEIYQNPSSEASGDAEQWAKTSGRDDNGQLKEGWVSMKYIRKLGNYVVNTPGKKLALRSVASEKGEALLKLEDGTAITVTKVTRDADAKDDAHRFWGLIMVKDEEGKDVTGYVCLSFLELAP